MRWKKIVNDDSGGTKEALIELGCKEPGNTRWYSYYCSNVGHISAQNCVGLFMSIKPRTAEKYAHIQHYARYKNCEEAEEVLCVRYPRDYHKKYLVVTSHALGECPVCQYHTKAEYYEQLDRTHERYLEHQGRVFE